MRLTTLCKLGWGPVHPRGTYPRSIQFLHVDQALTLWTNFKWAGQNELELEDSAWGFMAVETIIEVFEGRKARKGKSVSSGYLSPSS